MKVTVEVKALWMYDVVYCNVTRERERKRDKKRDIEETRNEEIAT